MKTRNGFTLTQLFGLGMLAELILVGVQVVYRMIYAGSHPELSAGFSADYMKDRGFYIFQVAGFFFYAVIIYFLEKKIRDRMMYNTMAFLAGGALIELSFYLVVVNDFEIAFLYSILDKAMAAVFAAILYFYTNERVRHV